MFIRQKFQTHFATALGVYVYSPNYLFNNLSPQIRAFNYSVMPNLRIVQKSYQYSAAFRHMKPVKLSLISKRSEVSRPHETFLEKGTSFKSSAPAQGRKLNEPPSLSFQTEVVQIWLAKRSPIHFSLRVVFYSVMLVYASSIPKCILTPLKSNLRLLLFKVLLFAFSDLHQLFILQE